jgi:hypothetical protein
VRDIGRDCSFSILIGDTADSRHTVLTILPKRLDLKWTMWKREKEGKREKTWS